MAPIAPFCAEDVYQHSHELIDSTSTSDALISPGYASTVFDSQWPLASDAWCDDAVRTRWSMVMEVQSKVSHS